MAVENSSETLPLIRKMIVDCYPINSRWQDVTTGHKFEVKAHINEFMMLGQILDSNNVLVFNPQSLDDGRLVPFEKAKDRLHVDLYNAWLKQYDDAHQEAMRLAKELGLAIRN
jgi:hypothetical protein